MRRSICLAFVLLGCLSVPAMSQRVASDSPTLPPVVVRELRVLEETYTLLDAAADKVWPGWTGYHDWPFQFTFENGLRVLVGHPSPPKGFELVEGLRIGDRPVTVDRSAVTPLLLTGPFSAGGGLLSYGTTAAGARVLIVDIKLRMPRPGEDLEAAQMPTTENKILTYLHELFHGFRQSFVRAPVGNLMYNADTDYATWSNVEGLALDRAYGETDPAAARERLKDFLVARALKRRSMTDEQQKEESSDDLMEGTANYAMVRALEVMKAGGFQPKLTAADDPAYHAFKNVDAMLAEHRAALKSVAARHEYPKRKCYEYGCFQALLAQRLVPGWQPRVQKGEFIDAVLASKLAIADDERPKIEQRLRDDYPYAAIRADAAKFIDARDAAWNQLKTRAGRTYIVDLKRTGQAVTTLTARTAAPRAPSYTLGLMTLFPSGFPGFTLDEIQVSATTVPALTDQLYYLKVVDIQPATREQPYSVTGARQADGTWLNETVTTPLFTLKAPKLRIRETGDRVKLQVLARVAGTT